MPNLRINRNIPFLISKVKTGEAKILVYPVLIYTQSLIEFLRINLDEYNNNLLILIFLYIQSFVKLYAMDP